MVHGVRPRRLLPACVLPRLRRPRLGARVAQRQRAGHGVRGRGRAQARGGGSGLLRWRALLCGPGRPGGGSAHDDQRRRLPARRGPQRHGRLGDVGTPERRPAAATLPPGHRQTRRERSRGQARRRGAGHAARMVGGARPRPPRARHRARRPHLRGPQRRHQPPEPGTARPRSPARRRHRADVHEPARVPRGALRRPAHRPAPHPHQLAPDRGGGRLHRRELRGEGVRVLGRAGREGHGGRGRRWAGPGQDQHGRLPARLRDVQHGGRRRGRRRHRRPGRRHPDALHVGHHGPAQGRAPGRRGGERAGHRQLLRLRRGLGDQCRRPPPDRPALPRRPAGLLGGGALPLRRAHRDHGPLGPRRGAAPDRAPRGHAHAHGADDVPPAAGAARGDEGSATTPRRSAS